MNLRILHITFVLCVSILIMGCEGNNIEGEENLPSSCLKYKRKAQEILKPFPDMLNDVEQTSLDINNNLINASDAQHLLITETCNTLLADLKNIEKEYS